MVPTAGGAVKRNSVGWRAGVLVVDLGDNGAWAGQGSVCGDSESPGRGGLGCGLPTYTPGPRHCLDQGEHDDRKQKHQERQQQQALDDETKHIAALPKLDLHREGAKITE